MSVAVGMPASAVRRSGDPAESVAEFARSALASIPDSGRAAQALSSAFDTVAERVDLYRSYDDLFSELSRRLDAILPEGPAGRALWGERLFQPLTLRLIEELRPEGLDLRLPEGRSAGLNQTQRARFAELFHAMAEGFRPQDGH